MTTDETNPSGFKKIDGDHSNIKGWGVDADPKNDPTYPIKKRNKEVKQGYTWERPPLQSANVEILRSIERPNLTATFGSSAPPSGISGKIRRTAFKYSESSYGRWLPLVLADRIGVYEGIVEDLKQGHFPNIFAERGWKAEWKYNRRNFVIKATIAAAVSSAVLSLVLSRKNEKWE